MSKLLTLQQEFSICIAKLVLFAESIGLRLTYGEAWRPPEMSAIYAERGQGALRSVHGDRLAVDFNLFKDGKYLKKTSDHARLGAYWKTLHPNARWGGDFKKRKDGNHYSFTPDGVRA